MYRFGSNLSEGARKVCRFAIVSLALFVLVGQSPAAAKVEGTCYNLPPNVVPITGLRRPGVPENVSFSVSPVLAANPLLGGPPIPIKNATFNSRTGAYSFEVDLPSPAAPLGVFINYSRDGFVATATLNRIILTEGVTTHIDLMVPLQEEMEQYSAPCACWEPEMRHRCKFFHRP